MAQRLIAVRAALAGVRLRACFEQLSTCSLADVSIEELQSLGVGISRPFRSCKDHGSQARWWPLPTLRHQVPRIMSRGDDLADDEAARAQSSLDGRFGSVRLPGLDRRSSQPSNARAGHSQGAPGLPTRPACMCGTGMC